MDHRAVLLKITFTSRLERQRSWKRPIYVNEQQQQRRGRLVCPTGGLELCFCTIVTESNWKMMMFKLEHEDCISRLCKLTKNLALHERGTNNAHICCTPARSENWLCSNNPNKTKGQSRSSMVDGERVICLYKVEWKTRYSGHSETIHVPKKHTISNQPFYKVFHTFQQPNGITQRWSSSCLFKCLLMQMCSSESKLGL